MSSDEIVKVCKRHGKLTDKECYNKKDYYNGKYYLKCQKCRIIYREKFYKKNKEKILTKIKSYGKEYFKKYFKKYIENMNDSYIKNLISANSTLSKKDIPQELVDTWRANLKLKRKLKELKKCQ